MPNKYAKKKGWDVPKQKYKLRNWSEINEALRRRGDITIWLSADAIAQWNEKDRVYNGIGTPRWFTDFRLSPAMKYDRFIDCLYVKHTGLYTLYFV